MLQVRSCNLNSSPNWSSTFEVSVDFVTDDANIAKDIMRNGLLEAYPGKVIVKCKHCGQWCARKTACKYCGASVD